MLEEPVQTLVPGTKSLAHWLAEVEARTQKLTARVDYQAGCTRRNNIRIMGLPEGIEGDNTLQYVED